jgi:class 3 adenylate cyclase
MGMRRISLPGQAQPLRAVKIASRVSGMSAPGEVLVSDTVRSLARTSAGVRFEDRGKRRLKGVAEPMRVYKVMVSGAGG